MLGSRSGKLALTKVWGCEDINPLYDLSYPYSTVKQKYTIFTSFCISVVIVRFNMLSCNTTLC